MGVLRLRKPIRFANRFTALRMTSLWKVQANWHTPFPNSRTIRRRRWKGLRANVFGACAAEAAEVRNDGELKAFRDRWMARKNGILTQINDLWLKGAPKEAKREAGIRVNELKTRIHRTSRKYARCRRPGRIVNDDARSRSTSLFRAFAVPLAPSIRSSRLRMRLFPYFRSSATPSLRGRWSRPITTTSRR